MSKKFVIHIFVFLLVVLCLTACSTKTLEGKNESDQTGASAQITNVRMDLNEDFGWWIVPKDAHKLSIFVEAQNTETVLFWVAPTGTETWSERELIGYDIDGSDGWSLDWEFGERIFHDHIYVQALGSDGRSMDDNTLNVTSVETGDGSG